MRKPKLDEDALSEELGAVAAFARRGGAKESAERGANAAGDVETRRSSVTRSAVRAPVDSGPRSEPPARTLERPYVRTGGRRTITRYAFEFFQDQLDQLQQLSLEEKLRGEKGSKSQMVREAIDMWIVERLQRND